MHQDIKKAISSSDNLLIPIILSGVSNIPSKLTSPEDSPDSYKLMGRIVSHANLPAPE